MRSILIAYALGVIGFSYAPRALFLHEWLAFAALVALLCCYAYMRNSRMLRYGAWALLGLLFGAAWMHYAAFNIERHSLASDWESRDLWVEGYVASLPQLRTLQSSERRNGVEGTSLLQRFDFALYKVYSAEHTERRLNLRRIRLNWYGRSEELVPGERYRLRVRLKRPHGFANPGGFDYGAYLLAHGIDARGYVRTDNGNGRLAGSDMRALHHRLRAYLRSALNNHYRGQHADLLLALGIGDRGELATEKRKLLVESGTAHLLAISGMHIGFVSWLLFRFSALLVRLSPKALLFAPANCWASVVALLGALLYAALAGFALPTQRALVMLAIVLLSILARRTLSFSLTFCVALAIVLSLQPLAAHLAGFWLSFVAVASLIIFFRFEALGEEEERRGPLRYLSNVRAGVTRLVGAQYAVGVALILPLGIFFHAIALLSFVCNLFAIPLVSMVVVPLCLLGFVTLALLPGLSESVFALAGEVLQILLLSVSKVLSVSDGWHVWYPPAWDWWVIALALVGTGGALWCRSNRQRLCALLLLFPLAIGGAQHSDRLRVEMLDVGQGLAVLIQTPNHAMLYDAGPKYGGLDVGSMVITPALRYRDVRTLDKMMLSHRDVDHIGGATSVMDQLRVGEVYISEAHPEIDDHKAGLFPDATHCYRGQRWRWDEVEFEVLHPPRDFDVAVENNRSCVLLVRTATHSVLLTGDINKRTELSLLDDLASSIPLSILFAGHHGSNTSSAARWTKALSPRYVFYSTGYRNRFGHPHPLVAKRFLRAGAQPYNTPTSGAVLARVDAHGALSVRGWRESRRRMWFR